MLIWTTATD